MSEIGMVETVARAISSDMTGEVYDFELYLDTARAAIEAMQEHYADLKAENERLKRRVLGLTGDVHAYQKTMEAMGEAWRLERQENAPSQTAGGDLAEPVAWITLKAWENWQAAPDKNPMNIVFLARESGPSAIPRVALYAGPAPQPMKHEEM